MVTEVRGRERATRSLDEAKRNPGFPPATVPDSGTSACIQATGLSQHNYSLVVRSLEPGSSHYSVRGEEPEPRSSHYSVRGEEPESRSQIERRRLEPVEPLEPYGIGEGLLADVLVPEFRLGGNEVDHQLAAFGTVHVGQFDAT